MVHVDVYAIWLELLAASCWMSANGLGDGTFTQRPRWHHHGEGQSLKSQVVSDAAMMVGSDEAAGGLEMDYEEIGTNF